MTRAGAIALAAAALVAVLAIAIALGPAGPAAWDVIASIRGPRVLVAAAAGGALALAGVLTQGALGNVLADPYVLGLSGGAAAGAVGALALGLPPGAGAATGAASAAIAVRALAGAGASTARLLLTGVTVGAIAASAAGLVLALAPRAELLRGASAWLLGQIGLVAWPAALTLAGAVAIAAAGALRGAAELDRLCLGDDVAAALGCPVRAVRRAALGAAIVLTALAVSACGLVGFVGLIAPHAARRLVGGAHRGLVPVATLAGAALLVAADAIARAAVPPREVPVGLVTALVGGPLFLALVRREVA